MPPPAVRERKRARTSPHCDEDAHTDDDGQGRPGSDDAHCPSRPGQAERKRELERNRRNLVNVRFIELEAELRRTAPRADPAGRLTLTPDPDPPAPTKGKRIDKEAVLKDAAHRLAVQRKDLVVASERMMAMSTEIDNLRAEKVELRSDKSYLRSELDTVRGEVQRLRSDNIHLWQALKKASSIKDAFASDVAKIPAELFLRRANIGTEQMTATAPMGSTMVHQPTSMPLQQLPMQPRGAPQMPRQAQHQVQPSQRQQQLRPGMSPQPDSQQSSPNPQGPNSQIPQPNVSTDSFLVLQTPEELTEFFQNIPGAIPNFSGTNPPTSRPEDTQMTALRNSPNMGGLPPSSAAQTTALTQQNARAATNASGPSDPLSKAENEEGDPFSDVAYCV